MYVYVFLIGWNINVILVEFTLMSPGGGMYLSPPSTLSQLYCDFQTYCYRHLQFLTHILKARSSDICDLSRLWLHGFALSVPDDSYSRNASSALNFISTIQFWAWIIIGWFLKTFHFSYGQEIQKPVSQVETLTYVKLRCNVSGIFFYHMFLFPWR